MVGEKAILKEYDMLKTKCERLRNQQLGFGNYSSILGSFSGGNEYESLQPRQGSIKRSKTLRGRQSMNSNKGGLGVNLLQNDGTRNGQSFNLSGGSASIHNYGINQSSTDNDDFDFGGKDKIKQMDEDIRSASSFLSKTSSKYEIDGFEEEDEDKEIKS